ALRALRCRRFRCRGGGRRGRYGPIPRPHGRDASVDPDPAPGGRLARTASGPGHGGPTPALARSSVRSRGPRGVSPETQLREGRRLLLGRGAPRRGPSLRGQRGFGAPVPGEVPLPALRQYLVGYRVADIPPILGSVDVCVGEVDR